MVMGETDGNSGRRHVPARNPVRRGKVIQVSHVVCLPGTPEAEERNGQVPKRLSLLQFLGQYPIFILAFGPPIFRLPDVGPAGAATAQAHADIWNVFQVAWIAAIALLAISRLTAARSVRIPRRVRTILTLIFLLGLVFLASVAYSPGRIVSLEMTAVYFLTLICILEFVAKVYQHPPSWMQCLFVLRLIYFLLFILIVLTIFFRPAIVMAHIPGAGIRLIGGRVGESGIVPEAITIISAYTFLYSLEPRPRAAFFFLVGVAGTAASQMRGAEIVLLLVLAVMAVRWAITSRRTAHLFVAASFGLVLLFSISMVVIGAERVWNVFNRGQSISSIESLSGRTVIWKFIMQYVITHPQGMGYVAGMRAIFTQSFNLDYGKMNIASLGEAHNLYLQYLADAGWVALGLYLFLVFKIVALGLRFARKSVRPISAQYSEARHVLRCTLLLLLYVLGEGMENSEFALPLNQQFYAHWILVAIVLGICAWMIAETRATARQKLPDPAGTSAACSRLRISMKPLVSLIALFVSVSMLSAQTKPGPPSAANAAAGSAGPRYDVTSRAFGAVGNGRTDDTAAIQAAFNACWNGGASPRSGVVEFPGTHTFVISKTIYAYDGCRIEGALGSAANGQDPTNIRWNGAGSGTAIAMSTFTTQSNNLYTPSNPSGVGTPQPYQVVVPATNSVSVGNWIVFQKCATSVGLELNNLVGEVAAVSSSSFTVTSPWEFPNLGTFKDSSCTATPISVMFATDADSHYLEEVKDVQMNRIGRNPPGVDIYFGDRVDTGTRISGAWVQGAQYFDYYFSDGGINIDFQDGWRADGAGLAAIYFRPGAQGVNSFGVENGTINNSAVRGSNGAEIMLDNEGCAPSQTVYMHSHNVRYEADTSMNAGLADITMLDCPSQNWQQFNLDLEESYDALPANNVYAPLLAMIPPNDQALTATFSNVAAPEGTDTPSRFVGLPMLTRYDLSGSDGYIPFLTYAAPLHSAGFTSGSYGAYAALAQFIGDAQFGDLYQKGVQASAFLYSDTAYAALPNATTLLKGQILAPPSYWSHGSTTTSSMRYAFDVVQQAGTTGTPNSGKTTCTTPGTVPYFICTSATDLGVGEFVSVGLDTDEEIRFVDATNPSNVLVWIKRGTVLAEVSTPTELTFTAPILGLEMQLPTKTSSAPSSETWSQGDFEENSEAMANGIAGWVNVEQGTPGTWAAIPLGNNEGKLSASQLSETTGTGKVVLSNSPIVNGLTDDGTAHLNNLTISGTCAGCGGQNLRTAEAFCTGTAASSATLAMRSTGAPSTTCASAYVTEDAAQMLMTTDGTVSSLAVRCVHSGVSPESGVFSIWDLPSGSALSGADSGVNTGVTVTYGTTPANTTVFDRAHRFAYHEGDLLRIQFTTAPHESLGDCKAAFNY
jgi:O-antigen ligase